MGPPALGLTPGRGQPMTIHMGNFSIVDDQQKPFEKILQAVDAKTATVIVDLGPCPEQDAACDDDQRVRQMQIAAGVRKARDDAGRLVPAGLPVGAALERLKLSPKYGPHRREGQPGGPAAKLVSLLGVADAQDANQGAWVVSGTAEGIAVDDVPLRDAKLVPGDTIVLTYLADRDDDGVPSTIETIEDTSERAKDTDGDGLSDRIETRVGWRVPLPGPPDAARPKPDYRVFSNPRG